jgi:hypothetical protein
MKQNTREIEKLKKTTEYDFLCHIYVNCEHLMSDYNIYTMKSKIYPNNFENCSLPKCEVCKNLVINNLKSICDNVVSSKNLYEYKLKEENTNKTAINQSDDKKKHKVEVDVYVTENINDTMNLFKQFLMMEKLKMNI